MPNEGMPAPKNRVEDIEIAHKAALAEKPLKDEALEPGISPDEKQSLYAVAERKGEAVINKLEAQSFQKIEEINGVGISVKWVEESQFGRKDEYQLYVFTPEIVNPPEDDETEEDITEEEERLASAERILDTIRRGGRNYSGTTYEGATTIIKDVEAKRAERKLKVAIDEKDRSENYITDTTIQLGIDPKKAERVYEYAKNIAIRSQKDYTPARRAYNVFLATEAFADG